MSWNSGVLLEDAPERTVFSYSSTSFHGSLRKPNEYTRKRMPQRSRIVKSRRGRTVRNSR